MVMRIAAESSFTLSIFCCCCCVTRNTSIQMRFCFFLTLCDATLLIFKSGFILTSARRSLKGNFSNSSQNLPTFSISRQVAAKGSLEMHLLQKTREIQLLQPIYCFHALLCNEIFLGYICLLGRRRRSKAMPNQDSFFFFQSVSDFPHNLVILNFYYIVRYLSLQLHLTSSSHLRRHN